MPNYDGLLAWLMGIRASMTSIETWIPENDIDKYDAVCDLISRAPLVDALADSASIIVRHLRWVGVALDLASDLDGKLAALRKSEEAPKTIGDYPCGDME